ncbi:MAG TPA: tRNA guanosine(34) transglycosylase Tgt [Saprospiraceae bacterium]|jgi:queuine tRNA-ribosyltransferase|nr:tRNA guanosine(34) transglycosylase Tgt [Saprospiraceae bacterium]HMT71476.1 tRNA guanosine(34) transglycosylase Tgt [Saprospiraceae bacterium]
MTFEIQYQDKASSARAGKISTDHGEIETPIFMPVGTQGTVKGVHQQELKDVINAQIILGNTYHLYLRPSTDILQKAGGLHKFINWDRPILTDSGGYQVYSLKGMRKITEEGVKFQSHIDGSRHFFSPESVMDIQRIIGADIVMAFDECTPYPCEYKYARNSMNMTHRWLKRCITRMNTTEPIYGHHQTFSPIVQGSTYVDLRVESAEFIAAQNQDMNAIGGLSVGEPHDEMYAMTELVCGILPKDKPRYLMGVGLPENILESIALGIDMFDCVLPSRNARHGILYTKNGLINIKNAKWQDDFSPIDIESNAPTSRIHTKAYLRHLFKVEELLAAQIATLHNLSFFLWLVTESRNKIKEGKFYDWKNQMVKSVSQRL